MEIDASLKDDIIASVAIDAYPSRCGAVWRAGSRDHKSACHSRKRSLEEIK